MKSLTELVWNLFMTLQTEYDFVLPRGFVDTQGALHRQGSMRLATALDEIEAVNDTRVQANEAYLPALLIARVVTRLGELPFITPQIITNLFASDLAFLEDLYQRLNSPIPFVIEAHCPNCQSRFQLQLAPPLTQQ
jgi:hypothetical protein